MIDLRIRELFFDRKAVTDATARGRSRALNRIGAYIRLATKRSMRRRKGASAPGTPPNAHTGLLRDHIYYSFDPASQTVVIGPALLKTPSGDDARPLRGTIPETLEQGGSIRVVEKPKQLRNANGGRRPQARTRTVRIAPRPSTTPALEQARQADKLSEFWRDVL